MGNLVSAVKIQAAVPGRGQGGSPKPTPCRFVDLDVTEQAIHQWASLAAEPSTHQSHHSFING